RSSPSRRVSLLIVVRPAPSLMRSASLTVQRLRHTGSNRFEANRFDRRVDVTCTARGQPRPVRCPTLRRALAHARCAAHARAPNPVSAAPPRRSTVEVMTRIGLVIAAPDRFPAADTLQDAVPLCAALRRRGATCRAVDWADAEVDWRDFDLAVLRSTWDYSQRPREFDGWLERAGAQTRILNEPDLVRCNIDKRYLRELEEAGIAVVPTSYHDDEQSLARALGAAAGPAAEGSELRPDGDEGAEPHVVLKPTVGAGAQLAGLLRPDD